ncbi:MAG TPA: hypothetical protein VFK05_31225 [Polyangiaceae bacterium]|nr:hypothetical protein [Polyangiaceae bacterium]
MRFDRKKVLAHATSYWYRPCEDGLVWLSERPIRIEAERAARKLSSDWVPVFLQTDFIRYRDGLFFIRNKHLSQLAIYRYHELEIPESDKILVQGWNGLNDCTHFVSECLSAGGLIIHELNVAGLVRTLQGRSDVQTLAEFVDFSLAKRIVQSGVMKEGDIIAFGTAAKNFSHGHAVVYMGNNQVCNHTHLNHPEFTGGNELDTKGNWERYSTTGTGHTRVLLFHYKDDLAVSARSPTLGYWSVSWRGHTYYYYFEGSGRISYTSHAPTDKAHAPAAVDGKGYWFDNSGAIKICWTKTGTLETFRSTGSNTMAGTWNDAEPISATKLG